MANKSTSKQRVDWCYQELLKCRATHQIAADLSKREGISTRQARRYVSTAFKDLKGIYEGIDRPDMLTKLIHGTETVLERALITGNLNAALGAMRDLNELMGLGYTHNAKSRPGYYGK
jgi:hypothetical protein